VTKLWTNFESSDPEMPDQRPASRRDILFTVPLRAFSMDIPVGYTAGVIEKWNEQVFSKATKSQAVRLPKRVAYPEGVKKVDIVIQGRARIITPAGESWDSWFDDKGVSEDFMADREQPESQERETL